MKKNVASQVIGAQCITAADGSAFTGSVTCYVTGDGGTQAAGSVSSGACTHEGNGFQTYAPAQAETNYDHIAFTFVGTGMIPVTIQVYTTYPQSGDSFDRIGVAGAGLTNINLPDQTMNITGNLSGSVGSVTGNVGGNVVGSVASVTGSVNSVTSAVTLPTIPASWITASGIAAGALDGKGNWNIGKTGYTLSQAFPTNFSSLSITGGGAVTAGTVSDKTGYSLSQAFPSNFADLVISAGTGRVTVGTNADKSGYSISGTLQTLDALENVSAAEVGTEVAGALISYDGATFADLSAAIGSLNDISPAQVNAEVVDALATDTYAEPGQGSPGATISIAQKINYLYKAWRNQSRQTATEYRLMNDAGTVVDHKAAVSDDGTTAIKGKTVTGP